MLQVNLENIRAAWSWWGQRGLVEQRSASLDPLFLFYERRSRFQEAERLFAEAIETVDNDPQDTEQRFLLGKLCARQGYFLYRVGAYDKAKMLLKKGLTLTEGDDGERALCQNYLGTLALLQGEQQVAIDLLQQSLTLRQALGDEVGVAASLNNLGSVAYFGGDYQSARQRYRESLSLSKVKEDLWSIAATENNLGEIARLLGDLDEAHALFEDSLSQCQRLEDRWGIAAAYNNLGSVAYMRQEWEQAKALHQQSLEIRKDLGDRMGTAVSLSNLGVVCFENGEFKDALELQSDSAKIRKELGDLRGAATTLCGLGKTMLALSHIENAMSTLIEGVKLANETEATPVMLDGLSTLAEGLFQHGNVELAINVLAFALHHDHADAACEDRVKSVLARYAPESTLQTLVAASPEGTNQTIKAILEQITKVVPLRKNFG